jgi:signal transduction histidine kinase
LIRTREASLIGESTVLRNTILNPMKFTHPCGRIIISEVEKQNELTVLVNDNDLGIPKERTDRLFKIEESYSTLSTQKEKGTRLGEYWLLLEYRNCTTRL